MLNKIASLRALYPNQYWLLFWGMLFSTIGASMIWPFLMVYASERLQLPMTQTASLITINSIASLIMTFVAGQITDIAGRKIVMVVSLITNAILYTLLSHANTYASFAVLMGLLGASNPLYRVGANAMLADLIPPDKRADGYSLIRMSDNAGVAIGPSIGGFLAAASQFLAFYIAGAALLLYGLLILLFARETLPKKTGGTTIDTVTKDGYGRILRDTPFMTVVLNSTLGLITAAFIWVLLPVYATQELGIPKQLYGFIPATNAAMVVLMQVAITQWTKHRPPLRMMSLSMVFYALGVGSVVLGKGFWGVWVSMIIITFGELIIAPTSSTFVANIAPETMRGRYMSIYSLTWSMSIGLGPIIGGLLNDNLGPPYIWIGGLFIGLISMALFFVIEHMFYKNNPVQPIT